MGEKAKGFTITCYGRRVVNIKNLSPAPLFIKNPGVK